MGMLTAKIATSKQAYSKLIPRSSW